MIAGKKECFGGINRFLHKLFAHFFLNISCTKYYTKNHSFIKAFEYIVKILACKTHDLARWFKILRENTQIQNMGSLHSLVHVMNPLHALVCVMNPLHTLVSVMNFTICSFSESIYSKAITNECNYCLLPS